MNDHARKVRGCARRNSCSEITGRSIDQQSWRGRRSMGAVSPIRRKLNRLQCRLRGILCTLALLAVSAFGALADDQPARGGILNIGITAKILGFDPFTTKSMNYEGAMVGGLIF